MSVAGGRALDSVTGRARAAACALRLSSSPCALPCSTSDRALSVLSATKAIVVFSTLTGPTGVPRGRKPRAGWAGGPLRCASESDGESPKSRRHGDRDGPGAGGGSRGPDRARRAGPGRGPAAAAGPHARGQPEAASAASGSCFLSAHFAEPVSWGKESTIYVPPTTPTLMSRVRFLPQSDGQAGPGPSPTPATIPDDSRP